MPSLNTKFAIGDRVQIKQPAPTTGVVRGITVKTGDSLDTRYVDYLLQLDDDVHRVDASEDELEFAPFTVGGEARAMVQVPGLRKAPSKMFAESPVFSDLIQPLAHSPFLVFEREPGTVRVLVVHSTSELEAFPADTLVLTQWPGKQRSDWFWFLVEDYRAWLLERSLDNLDEGEGSTS